MISFIYIDDSRNGQVVCISGSDADCKWLATVLDAASMDGTSRVISS